MQGSLNFVLSGEQYCGEGQDQLTDIPPKLTADEPHLVHPLWVGAKGFDLDFSKGVDQIKKGENLKQMRAS